MNTAAASEILDQSVLFVDRIADSPLWMSERQLKILLPTGQQVGTIEEETNRFGTILARQFAPDRRSIKLIVRNSQAQHIFTIKRPVKKVHATIKCYTPEGELVGKTRHNIHAWRRRYTIYDCRNILEAGSDDEDDEEESKSDHSPDSKRADAADVDPKFGFINAPPMSYDFPVTTPGKKPKPIANITRKWSGVGREFFTDAGLYAVDFEPGKSTGYLDMARQATLIGTAVLIDCDYFSWNGRNGQNNGFMMTSMAM